MQRGGQDIVLTDILLPVIRFKHRVVNVKVCHRIEGLRRGFNTGFELSHVAKKQWLRVHTAVSSTPIAASATPSGSKGYASQSLWRTTHPASTRTNSCWFGSQTSALTTLSCPGPRGWLSQSRWHRPTPTEQSWRTLAAQSWRKRRSRSRATRS